MKASSANLLVAGVAAAMIRSDWSDGFIGAQAPLNRRPGAAGLAEQFRSNVR